MASKSGISYVQRLVLEHPQGDVPTVGSLDTRDKIDAYVERMTEATQDELLANRRARARSIIRAQTRIVV